MDFSKVLSIELANSIKDALISKMPEQKEEFEKNFDLLEDDLIELDERFKEMATTLHQRPISSHMRLLVILPTIMD